MSNFFLTTIMQLYWTVVVSNIIYLNFPVFTLKFLAIFSFHRLFDSFINYCYCCVLIMILMSSTHLFLLLHRIWKGGCTIAEAPPTLVSVHWTPEPSVFSTFPDW